MDVGRVSSFLRHGMLETLPAWLGPPPHGRREGD